MPKNTGGGGGASMPSPGTVSSHAATYALTTLKTPRTLSYGFYGDLTM